MLYTTGVIAITATVAIVMRIIADLKLMSYNPEHSASEVFFNVAISEAERHKWMKSHPIGDLEAVKYKLTEPEILKLVNLSQHERIDIKNVKLQNNGREIRVDIITIPEEKSVSKFTSMLFGSERGEPNHYTETVQTRDLDLLIDGKVGYVSILQNRNPSNHSDFIFYITVDSTKNYCMEHDYKSCTCETVDYSRCGVQDWKEYECRFLLFPEKDARSVLKTKLESSEIQKRIEEMKSHNTMR